ncbi:MAG: type II toxin-antitoxin system VapC family toxin [Rhizobiaceae bacterium]
MKITPDTNVLLRAFMGDDPVQKRIAVTTIQDATLIALPLPILCEVAWVLTRNRKFSRMMVAGAIRDLIASARVETDRLAVEAGLRVLESGGDFADGAIAYQGREMGADLFVTFDKKAHRLLGDSGISSRLLGP